MTSAEPKVTDDDLTELLERYVPPVAMPQVRAVIQELLRDVPLPDPVSASLLDANEGFARAQQDIAEALGMYHPHQRSSAEIVARAKALMTALGVAQTDAREARTALARERARDGIPESGFPTERCDYHEGDARCVFLLDHGPVHELVTPDGTPVGARRA